MTSLVPDMIKELNFILKLTPKSVNYLEKVIYTSFNLNKHLYVHIDSLEFINHIPIRCKSVDMRNL